MQVDRFNLFTNNIAISNPIRSHWGYVNLVIYHLILLLRGTVEKIGQEDNKLDFNVLCNFFVQFGFP